MWLDILLAGVGGVIGWSLPWLDKLAYVYILHPEVQVSQYVKFKIKQKQYKSAFETLNSRGGEFDKLTTRSFLFQVAWIGLAIFAISSVGSLFGKTLVMALGLRILAENWKLYLTEGQRLKSSLFWQVKREISNKELKWYMYGMSGLFLGLIWWWV